MVVYPSKRDRLVHIGRVAGLYRYASELEPGYRNLLPVKWLSAVPRTQFSHGAL
jgi:restriction system protein